MLNFELAARQIHLQMAAAEHPICDDFLPQRVESREKILMEFEKHQVFEAADGMSDLGEIAKAYCMSEKSDISFNQAFELGAKVMRKKLHLHGIITSDDVNAKRMFRVFFRSFMT